MRRRERVGAGGQLCATARPAFALCLALLAACPADDQDAEPDGAADNDAAAPDADVPDAEVSLPDALDPQGLLPASDAPFATPPELAPGHLLLWLRADHALDCGSQKPGRVATWGDLSGRDHHARAPAGKKGPRCGEATINGLPAVTFTTTDALDEGHLEVDLAGLVGAPFTLAVVERRSTVRFNAYLLGARLPFPDAIVCNGVNRGRGFVFGYQRPSTLQVSAWGEDCQLVAMLPTGEKPRTSVLVATFSPTAGFALFRDGRPLATYPAATAPLEVVDQGLIGRGFEWYPGGGDSRYAGDIAEIVVFDQALEPADRAALERTLAATWAPN